MADQLSTDKSSPTTTNDYFKIQAPAINLPKGGGAIKGIGEKFAANPVTGTGSLTVPIATSPGRNDFGPQLSLAYDSGSGNGPFGFGWSLSLPSITRKTDKGLPKYLDGDESDIFILSGSEDLVPVLNADGTRWQEFRNISGANYSIHRYRPRIEGLFARIERWTNTRNNETHWRSISRENIVTVYGRTNNCRIEDPTAPEDAPRVFSWLICESYDDKGNAIYYEYLPENSAGTDPAQTNERNRTDTSRSANRYLKRIKYGNRTPVECGSHLPREFRENLSERSDWLFEVVFDYKQGHHEELPVDAEGRRFVHAYKDPIRDWPTRQDPFSSYRSGFEVRTYRLCHRLLMFHHFPDELGVEDCLVRATEFEYQESPIASFITSATQSGFKRQENGTYLKKSLPPLEFEYSQATIQDQVQEVDPESLENLPQGLDGTQYQWVDIDGEGLSGILTEQGDAWFFKRNESALPVVAADGKTQVAARFAPAEYLPATPSFTNLSTGRQQLLDLAGDGQLDVAEFDSPTPGFYERTKDQEWHLFRPFESLPIIAWQDPNLKFVDLTGDGHADIVITEDDALTWYQSLGEIGFAPGEKVHQALDEEKGPKLIFADGTQSIHLADVSGDGLTDLVRIRNGEVCYWPNLGYGRFGPKVTMDNSPLFDIHDQFDQRRIRLADIDGSGVTDIIYLNDDGVHLFLNESGNRWADRVKLKAFPKIDNLSSVMAVDLLGNGTACLVWSTPLPAANGKPMRYIDLMGGQKPHLLVKTVNNLGAETRVHYAPSTKFYLADKVKGKPWITRIPFPVHVVERIETYDRISRNRFVTRYAYHHGYFDGEEREFRGFGMVEQWDTESYAALSESREFPSGDNVEETSHVPPVLTKTWFHTGAYLGRHHISNFHAGLLDADDIGEYYREPGPTDLQAQDLQAQELLLEDTVLPYGLTAEEAREACRALKGAMLRREVYALDGTDEAPHPYTVTEQNFSIRLLQPEGNNRYGVFFTHPREAVTCHYERQPADPRVQHAMTLEVDDFGNVLKEVAIGYGRRETIRRVNDQGETEEIPNPGFNQLSTYDKKKQTDILITYTENGVTNAIDDSAAYPDDFRTPLPWETRTYELTGFKPENNTVRFSFNEWTRNNFALPNSATQIPYEQTADDLSRQKRLIEHVRTLYRPDDLGIALNDLLALLSLGRVEPLALAGESYKLAFTPGLLTQVYQRSGQPLLPDPAGVLGGQGPDQGGYVDLDGDGHWWIPAGRMFHSPHTSDTAVQELAHARQHYFLPHRYTDPFGQTSAVAHDAYDLLIKETRDALDNRVTSDNDYRVLQPNLVTDPNRNRSAVAFDALGMVVGTAVMGKTEENLGDSLDGFEPDLDDTVIQAHLRNPLTAPHDLLQSATTRLVYDLHAYQRTKDTAEPRPGVVYTLARETHDADLAPEEQTRIQHSFSYSDGFGREIQKKIQAEPGPLDPADPHSAPIDPRWVGSGWTIFNNKGKPVRQYEPFFDDTHDFKFGQQVGVSPILFYDPLERVVATLHPDHTYEKVVFDPWRQETWDVNDTVLRNDPENDPDAGDFFARLPETDYLPTWYERRISGAMGPAEQSAAEKTAAHADTPAIAFLDTLGRTFLTIADNGSDGQYPTRIELDIEGNTRAVIDARGNTVMAYAYSIAGPGDEDEEEADTDEQESQEGEEEGEKPDSRRIYQKSMDAGERWMLYNVAQNPIRAWDSRDHTIRTVYDPLQRPTHLLVRKGEADERLTEHTIYGEDHGNPEGLNLRGEAYRVHDGAGRVTNGSFDFKGNLLQSTRQLAVEYKEALDWWQPPALEQESFTTATTYDALNRPASSITPDASETRHTYNEANLLEKVDVRLRGAAEWTPFVLNIDYDAKGRRERIEYGNGVTTEYDYDPETFRLTRLMTTRGGDNKKLQDLSYTYDPSGNITGIADDAQQTEFFDNQVVTPSGGYAYDALYRLIKAEGREHAGQNGNSQPDHRDIPRMPLPHANDDQALRRYTEQYEYDSVGNILKMIHQASNGNWTRRYRYADNNNRLLATSLPGDPEAGPYTATYDYDAHGSMIRMPHLPAIKWDHEDQMHEVDLGGGGTAYYVYDTGGKRVRKVHQHNGATMEERIYVGGFEIYRVRNGNGLSLERETLHVMDDEQRIAMVETKTYDQNPIDTPVAITRYQLNNHLGSSSLEVDESGSVISFEEYHPYGTTSYHSARSGVEVSLKRFRYTGKERDEETGLNYHEARYYASWLGNWTSTDPTGLMDGLNLYVYGRNNPIAYVDSSGTQCDPIIQSCYPNYQVQLNKEGILLGVPKQPYRVKIPFKIVQKNPQFKGYLMVPWKEEDPFENARVTIKDDSIWNKGLKTTLIGIASLTVALLSYSNPLTFLGGLAFFGSMVSGVAFTGMGIVQLATSPLRNAKQDKEFERGMSVTQTLASPPVAPIGAIIGGWIGKNIKSMTLGANISAFVYNLGMLGYGIYDIRERMLSKTAMAEKRKIILKSVSAKIIEYGTDFGENPLDLIKRREGKLKLNLNISHMRSNKPAWIKKIIKLNL